ncbi:hypothetical protein Aperf_G00000080991 [Anoplocephala perfoliata]
MRPAACCEAGEGELPLLLSLFPVSEAIRMYRRQICLLYWPRHPSNHPLLPLETSWPPSKSPPPPTTSPPSRLYAHISADRPISKPANQFSGGVYRGNDKFYVEVIISQAPSLKTLKGMTSEVYDSNCKQGFDLREVSNHLHVGEMCEKSARGTLVEYLAGEFLTRRLHLWAATLTRYCLSPSATASCLNCGLQVKEIHEAILSQNVPYCSECCLELALKGAPLVLGSNVALPSTSVMKPDIVFFLGEDLPPSFYSNTDEDIRNADPLLVIGNY